MFPLKGSIPLRITPIVTYAIIGLNVLVFMLYGELDAKQLQHLFHDYGLVPARYSRSALAEAGLAGSVLPFVTAMFLHGGPLHLLGNMWTFWIFGPAVEERMGGVRYASFYFLVGIVAGIVHVATNAGSPIPTVGASGAIAGIMGAYLVLYPRAQILFVIPIFIYPFFFVWPAAAYLLYWFGLQFLSGAFTLVEASQVGGVAWWAHVGGFFAGALGHRLFLRPPRTWNPPRDHPSFLYREH